MTFSPTVRSFTSEHYAVDPNRAVMVNLARLITIFYHDLVTGAHETPPVLAPHAFNAYMILAMIREMTQGE